jgi:PAS domain S-box-containing protein
LSFRPKVIAAFGTALLVLVYVGSLSYRKTVQEYDDQRWVAHTHLVLEGIAAVLAGLVNEQTEQRGFILSGNDAYLELFSAGELSLHQDIQRLRVLTSDNPSQQAVLDDLEPLIATSLHEMKEGISARQREGNGSHASRHQMPVEAPSMGQARSLIATMKQEEQQLLTQRIEKVGASSRRTRILIVFGNIIAFLSLFISALVIFQEMNRRHEAERSLIHNEERFRLMVSGVKDYAILMLDPEGNVASWNVGAERTKGYTSEEILGKHFSIFHEPEDVKAGKPDRLLKIAEEEGRTEDEGWRVRKDGSRFWANVIVTALRDENGTLRGFSKVTRDMTERRRAEQALESHNIQLAAANKELQAFSYSVSHDLRAPLRSIDGFSLALLEDYEAKLDSEGKNYLQRIRAATVRMGQLIDGMLNLARISRAGLVREEVDLSRLAREIVSELENSEPERKATFEISPALPVRGDRLLLRVVLENLLNNAWKFTSHTANACISVGSSANGSQPVHFVRDNGAGFDMQYASKLFGVFQRLHRDSEFPGNGVGLATVQRIIHRHGGRIWAEGSLGGGATFYFVLGSQLEE